MAAEQTVYDVAIVGGGPAGYTAAIRAGQNGLKVALLEREDKLGGTCLHWGCIPTKAMLFNAEIYEFVENAAEYGIEGIGKPTLNWGKVLERKNGIITKHVKGLDFLMRKNKVTVVRGQAKLTGPARDGIHTIAIDKASNGVGEKGEVKARNVVIATGSDARMLPGIEPGDHILTNNEILIMPAVPKSMIIIGSGAVGVEFGSIFRSFGAEITIVEYLPRIVPAEDEEVSKELQRTFRKRGIDVHTGARVEKVEKTATGARVTWIDAQGKQVVKEAEKVLVAVGRAPRTDGIGLETLPGIKLEKGFIQTDEWMATGIEGVYAIGDIVAGLPQLAHVGAMCGIVVASKLAGKYARPVKRNLIPGCTYTEPQIGSVGLSEAQAREKGLDIKVGKFPFSANSKASIINSHEGFVKVVTDAKYGEVIGVHIIGPSATELIAEAVVAMTLEATLEELMFTIHAHPTLAEAMLDGFGAVEGLAINV
ncbi:dihydrolipoyl dehydrogenase [Acidipila sp. EB88]|uniref:dihydrolipoyl dehydrogenase n=1 Tax=Acidipila sp. EB88 TaxID=2305226 RepID=UPI000F5E83EB|nr:dihydrolipoyl dehydrogenase [Acidipila sp. EB88]RRA48160.1 dihydrolipoyl dehydrogenase [Acidipila sp. EB88]